MASVTIRKHTMASASSGQINHCYRKHENYRNQDIDSSLTGENIYLGCNTSDEARAKLHGRIEECDSIIPPKRVRQDRVVAVEYCIPAPREGMPVEQQEIFLRAAYEKMEQVYGNDIIFGAIHRDEVHHYEDSVGEHTSRHHLHVMGVPRTETKGINGKEFLKRQKYHEINELMDEVCMSLFGYKYQDGTKQKSKGTVEQLKQGEKNAKEYVENAQNEMAKREILFERKQIELEEEFSNLQEQAENLRQEVSSLREEAESLKQETSDLESLRNEKNALKGEIQRQRGILEKFKPLIDLLQRLFKQKDRITQALGMSLDDEERDRKELLLERVNRALEPEETNREIIDMYNSLEDELEL